MVTLWLRNDAFGIATCRWDGLLTCRFFFFSSRRRHTRFDCDWSSDVCSSDLEEGRVKGEKRPFPLPPSPKSTKAKTPPSIRPAVVPKGVLIPPIDLLNPAPPEDGDAGLAQIEQMGRKLIETLQTFRVEGSIAGRTVGPVVTQYEVAPGPGVKVGRIAALADDLALAMRAQSLRIVAPIPGKAAVGIEVPNPMPRMVHVRELIEGEEFHRGTRVLPIALGKNLEGEPVVADLVEKPLKGQRATLTTPSPGSPGIQQELPFDAEYTEGVLPYVVVILDELADLMMTVQHEVETPLATLAQKARAVGIHLILATQRPSVNVITGLIKANFSCRIAFRVASKVDSRTILDQNGAETLLGNGDMLFLPPGKSEPVRIQGCFISTDETERLMSWYTARRAQLEQRAEVDIIEQMEHIAEAEKAREEGGGTSEAAGERDSLFRQAAEVCIQNQIGSTSLLQRRMSIGYGRAARIIDQLELAGVLGPANRRKPPGVLVGFDEFDG